jgi:hypothetical protein
MSSTAKSQNSDAFAIQTPPLYNDFVVAPTLGIARQGDQVILRWPAEAAPFHAQQAADPLAPQWDEVPTTSKFDGNCYTLERIPLLPAGAVTRRAVQGFGQQSTGGVVVAWKCGVPVDSAQGGN